MLLSGFQTYGTMITELCFYFIWLPQWSCQGILGVIISIIENLLVTLDAKMETYRHQLVHSLMLLLNLKARPYRYNNCIAGVKSQCACPTWCNTLPACATCCLRVTRTATPQLLHQPDQVWKSVHQLLSTTCTHLDIHCFFCTSSVINNFAFHFWI
jgi:hypothetical protein